MIPLFLGWLLVVVLEKQIKQLRPEKSPRKIKQTKDKDKVQREITERNHSTKEFIWVEVFNHGEEQKKIEIV